MNIWSHCHVGGTVLLLIKVEIYIWAPPLMEFHFECIGMIKMCDRIILIFYSGLSRMLVISDSRGITISATWWHNHTGYHWGPYWNVKSIYTTAPSLVWNKSHSVDTARWKLDRLLWHLMMGRVVWGDFLASFPGPRPASCCLQYRAWYISWYISSHEWRHG